MTMEQILVAVHDWSFEEKRELLAALVNDLGHPGKKLHKAAEFEGAAAHLYDGTDAQEYVSAMRDEWDAD